MAGCSTARYAIYSRPGGAEVYIDDVLTARTISEATPVRVELKPGDHLIELKRPGYYDWKREVEAHSGKEVAVLADLEMLPPPPRHIPSGTLEFRTNPGEARILLNEEEVAYTKREPNRPVKIEKVEPGRYKVRIEREGYEPIEDIFRVFAGQTTKGYFDLVPLPPYFAFATNDDLLRQAVAKAVRGVSFMSGMGRDQSIAIVQLSGAKTDPAFRNLIEDVMIADLVHNGRIVAERDNHLLVRIANEAARGDSLTLDILTYHESADKPFLYDARLRPAADALAVYTDRINQGEVEIIIRPEDDNPAHVPTADQILGYKLVEKSLRVDPGIKPGASERMLRRQAIVRLYCRLLDARTGMVLWASRYEASVSDEVPERVYQYLKAPPSREYAYEENETNKVRLASGATINPEEENKRQVKLKLSDQVRSLFWYYRNIGEGYLRAGRLVEALGALEEAVRLRPEDYETRVLLGEVKLKSGDMIGAGEEYKAAIRSIAGP